jgi:hypothetical protein
MQFTKTEINTQNDHKLYQIAITYIKQQQKLTNGREIYLKVSIPKQNIYQKWYFWYENKPSGNPGLNPEHKRCPPASKGVGGLLGFINLSSVQIFATNQLQLPFPWGP